MKDRFPEWWDKGLEDWSVDNIFEKLKSFGIKIDKDKFLALTEKYSSSQDLSESELYPQVYFPEEDKEEDFVWMAADELWKKLRTDKKSFEMIAEEIEKYFEEAENLEWKRFKNKIVELEQQGFDVLINYCDREGGIKGNFYNDLKPHFLDVEYYLCVFQDHLAYLERWEKRLEVSKKIYFLEPENVNSKDLYAEVLLYWGYIDEGEKLYNETINDFPVEIWHAVHCADMFFLGYEGMKLNKDFEKAEKYYLIAERRFTEKINWEDRESIIQRLFDLYSQWGNKQKVEEYRKKRSEFERDYLEDAGKYDDFTDLSDIKIGSDTQFSHPKKVGRNESCPCGSGRKYKKCCGK